MIEGAEVLSFLLTPGLGGQGPHTTVTHEFKASILRDFDALEEDWAALMRVAEHGRNFINDPSYLREFVSGARGSLSPLIVAVRQGERLAGIAPFFVSEERIPIRLSLLKLASVPVRRLRLLSESFVIAPGVDVQSFHQRVFDELAQATDFNVVHLHELREQGALWPFVNNPSIPHPYRLAYATEPQTSHDISLQADHSDYERALTSENRKKLRKRRRLLTEHFHGEVRLVAVREAGQVDGFLAAVDEIAGHTWQARAYGQRTRNAASDIAHFKFLAEHGWLRSYLLTGGGEPLAFQIGIQYAEQFHFLETGYDSRRSKFAPGNVLQTMLIEDLYNVDKPRFADYGFGEGESKRILGNVSCRRWEHVFLVRNRAAYPRAVFFGIALAARIEAGIRKVLEWTGSERFIRNLIKRRGNDQ